MRTLVSHDGKASANLTRERFDLLPLSVTVFLAIRLPGVFLARIERATHGKFQFPRGGQELFLIHRNPPPVGAFPQSERSSHFVCIGLSLAASINVSRNDPVPLIPLPLAPARLLLSLALSCLLLPLASSVAHFLALSLLSSCSPWTTLRPSSRPSTFLLLLLPVLPCPIPSRLVPPSPFLVPPTLRLFFSALLLPPLLPPSFSHPHSLHRPSRSTIFV